MYRIPCECGKIYIGETASKPMQNRIKEHNKDIRLNKTETSAVSERKNGVKFIDRDPHLFTRRVKEAIYVRLHPNNNNRDNGIGVSEAWMPTIEKHNSRKAVRQRTTLGN